MRYVMIRWAGFRRVLFCALLCAVAAQAQGPVSSDPVELWKQATIYRDIWGAPHVFADTFRAMAFASGYAQAEDHIEAVLKAYRVANGRAAEVWGEGYADSDAFALQMNHAGLAAEAYRNADPVTRDLCEGFSLGVNAWLAEHAAQAPSWAEGARPADVLALLHAYLMSFAPFDLKDVFHRPPAAISGNAWAIAPGHSADGRAILVMNPHADYEGPFQWCEAQLVAQDYDVSGATLCGLPIALMGHNRALGWALTPNQADFADVYEEPLPETTAGGLERAEAEFHLRLLSQPRPYYVRTDGGLQQRAVDVMDAGLGPVIGKTAGRFCSYHIGGYRDFGALRQLVEMGRAADLGAFQNALALQQLPCFHVLYADGVGNIFYLYNAKVGRKAWSPPPASTAPPAPSMDSAGNVSMPKPPDAPKLITDWTKPVPAGDSTFAWGDTIPMDLLPMAVNPPSGYLQGCGAPPWLVTDDSGLRPADWPLWFAADRDTYRAQRARLLLRAPGQTFEGAQALLFDAQAPFAFLAARFLADAATAQPKIYDNAHPDAAHGVDAITQWDGVASTDNVAAAFYVTWWATLRKVTAADYPGDGALMQAIASGVEALRGPAITAASEAAIVMRNEFQTATPPWGEVHTLQRGARSVPFPGIDIGEPIFVASSRKYENKQWRVTYGSAFAMAIRFGERIEAVSLSPFGASDRPDSPHYADQLDLMLQRRLKPAWFEADDVLTHAERAYGAVALLRAPGTLARVRMETTGAPAEFRLRTLLMAPSALPAGVAAFSPYVSAACAPEQSGLRVHVEIGVPETLCAAGNLGKLAVYAYADGRGWFRLPAQEQDAARRTCTAQDDSPKTYALVGPPECRIAQPAPAPLVVPEPPQKPASLADAPESETAPEENTIMLGPRREQGAEASSSEGASGELPPPLIAPGVRFQLMTPRGEVAPTSATTPGDQLTKRAPKSEAPDELETSSAAPSASEAPQREETPPVASPAPAPEPKAPAPAEPESPAPRTYVPERPSTPPAMLEPVAPVPEAGFAVPEAS